MKIINKLISCFKQPLRFSIEPDYIVERPTRGTKYSAGIDVYVPVFNDVFREKFKSLNQKLDGVFKYKSVAINDIATQFCEKLFIEIPDHGRVLIPTGLRFEIPKGTYLEVANRGSVASKQGLVYGAHIIDEDYRGEVFINLINTTNNTITIEQGSKIAQLIHKKYENRPLYQIDKVPLETERGEGALGHTNKKDSK